MDEKDKYEKDGVDASAAKLSNLPPARMLDTYIDSTATMDSLVENTRMDE